MGGHGDRIGERRTEDRAGAGDPGRPYARLDWLVWETECHLDAGAEEDARRAIAEAMALVRERDVRFGDDPDDRDDSDEADAALLPLARALRWAGDFAGARELFDRGSMNRDWFDEMLEVARLQFTAGDREGARHTLTGLDRYTDTLLGARETLWEYPCAMADLAEVQRLAGDADGARAGLAAARNEVCDYSDGWVWDKVAALALVAHHQMQNGDAEEAQATLELIPAETRAGGGLPPDWAPDRRPQLTSEQHAREWLEEAQRVMGIS